MLRSILRVALIFGAVTGVGVATYVFAQALDRAPDQYFVQNGQTLRWGAAHGIVGSVSVAGPVGPDGRELGLVLTCSGLTSGGVQARFYAPRPHTPQLRVRMDDVVLRVRPKTYNIGGPDFVEGQGDLPAGYFKSLAKTQTISVEYDGQVTTFPGPGEVLARHFGRYCAELARKASHDE